MVHESAPTRMKALVAARLLMGEFGSWTKFKQEREIASKIMNRQTARSVSSQIGRNYRDLTDKVGEFIENNFVNCNVDRLSSLCDNVSLGYGIVLPLEEFEEQFIRLAPQVKNRFPIYAHVHVSIWGLQFEFPESHFLRDLEASLSDLLETKSRLIPFMSTAADPKRDREQVADLIARGRFLSRSMTSAAFSLVESLLSGLFFTATQMKSIGLLTCDEKFLKYAETKESASLKDRLDQVVRFASKGIKSGSDEPFKSFEGGKRYRDAIHHTTPFQRKGVEAGGRLAALYEIGSDVALSCAEYSLDTTLAISGWVYGASDTTEIETLSRKLVKKVRAARISSIHNTVV